MKILKKIGLICCAIIVGVASFLIPKHYNMQSLLVAKADSVTDTYSFNGSNTLTLPIYYNNTGGVQEFINFNFKVSFSTLNNQTTIIPDFSYYVLSSGVYGATLIQNMFYSNNWHSVQMNSFIVSNSSVVIYASRDSNSIQSGAFLVAVKGDNNFNSNIYKIRMYMPDSFLVLDNNINYSHPLHIVYYDNNDNCLTFEMAVPTNYPFNDRTYYIVNSSELTDSQQYNAGYQEGLQANQDNIYNQGRTDGFNGGYNQGYQEGVSSASNNNFFTLIGAAVDVPITALTSLLNFTFLGVNLLAFVTSILTLALIIFVIKKFMGKG